MVNAEYLENLAQHRFGISNDDERYLDKFVDIRLRLQPEKSSIENAVIQLASELPLKTPFAEDAAFSVDAAAKLAAALAIETGLSMRKVKRVLLKVELALRCYSDQPLDAPLLVFLAFEDAKGENISSDFLPRTRITPERGDQQVNLMDEYYRDPDGLVRHEGSMMDFIRENAVELLSLPRDRYQFPNNRDYKGWVTVFKYLAPHYIPEHRKVLNSVAEIQVSDDD
jgi:hypothetical protein